MRAACLLLSSNAMSVVAVEVGGLHGLRLFPVPPLAHLALPLEVLLEVVPLRTVARRQHAGVQPLWKNAEYAFENPYTG